MRSDSDLIARLSDVFRNVLGDQLPELSRATTANDVAAWDSLMHINLIVAIEREFKVRFTTREINALRNVGDLMDLIARKSASAA
jgi:acyl carrier protein